MLGFVAKRPGHAAAASLQELDVISAGAQEIYGRGCSDWQPICREAFGALVTMRMEFYLLIGKFILYFR